MSKKEDIAYNAEGKSDFFPWQKWLFQKVEASHNDLILMRTFPSFKLGSKSQ